MNTNPYPNRSPYTKEQIKRRTFWINFGIIAWSLGIWIILTILSYIKYHKL